MDESIKESYRFWRVPTNRQSALEDVYGSVHEFSFAPFIELSIYSHHAMEILRLSPYINVDATCGVVKDIEDVYGGTQRMYNFNWVVPSPFGEVLNLPVFEYISGNKSRQGMQNAMEQMITHYNHYFSSAGNRFEHFSGLKYVGSDCDQATMGVK